MACFLQSSPHFFASPQPAATIQPTALSAQNFLAAEIGRQFLEQTPQQNIHCLINQMSDIEDEDDQDSQETNSYSTASEHSYSDHHNIQPIRTGQNGGKRPPLPPAGSKRRGQASNPQSIKKPNLPLMTSTIEHDDSLLAPIPHKMQPVAASKEMLARKQLLLEQQDSIEDSMSQADIDAVELLGGTKNTTTKKKRGPGRPRKDGSAPGTKRGPGRPKKNPDDPNAPKRKPGRPKKEPDPNAPPKRKPGRPRKNPPVETAPPFNGESTTAEVAVPPPPPRKRGPGRPKKNPAAGPPKKRGRPKKDSTTAAVAPDDFAVAPPPKKRRGRPRKDQQKSQEQHKVYGGYHLGGKSVPAMLGGTQPQQQTLSRSMDEEEEEFCNDESLQAEPRTPAAGALLDFRAGSGGSNHKNHHLRRTDSPTEEEDPDLVVQGDLYAAMSNHRPKQTSTSVGDTAMNGVAKLPSSKKKGRDDFDEDDSDEDDQSNYKDCNDKQLHGTKTDPNLEESETEDDPSLEKTAASSSFRRRHSEQPVDDQEDEENEIRDHDHQLDGMSLGKAVHDPEPEHQHEIERCVCHWKDCETIRRRYRDVCEKEGDSIYAGFFCVEINGGERQANFLDAIDNNLATNLETRKQTTGQYAIARHHWTKSVLEYVDSLTPQAIYKPVGSKVAHDLGVDTKEEANRYCTTLEEDEFGRMRPVRSNRTMNYAQWILVPNRKYDDVKIEVNAWLRSRIELTCKERQERAQEGAAKDAQIKKLQQNLETTNEELKEKKEALAQKEQLLAAKERDLEKQKKLSDSLAQQFECLMDRMNELERDGGQHR